MVTEPIQILSDIHRVKHAGSVTELYEIMIAHECWDMRWRLTDDDKGLAVCHLISCGVGSDYIDDGLDDWYEDWSVEAFGRSGDIRSIKIVLMTWLSTLFKEITQLRPAKTAVKHG